MKDKLHIALERIVDVAEQNGTIVSWQIPECDEDGHSVLIQNARGCTGLIYHNCDIPETPVCYYIMDIELYHWACLEGFDDADIFESADFNILEKAEADRFCDVICKCEKEKRNSPRVTK